MQFPELTTITLIAPHQLMARKYTLNDTYHKKNGLHKPIASTFLPQKMEPAAALVAPIDCLAAARSVHITAHCLNLWRDAARIADCGVSCALLSVRHQWWWFIVRRPRRGAANVFSTI